LFACRGEYTRKDEEMTLNTVRSGYRGGGGQILPPHPPIACLGERNPSAKLEKYLYIIKDL